MSEVLAFLGQLFIAIGFGCVVVAIIHSYLAPKTRAEMRDVAMAINEHRRHVVAVEVSLLALERSAFAPISDAVREGEERAVREWGQR